MPTRRIFSTLRFSISPALLPQPVPEFSMTNPVDVSKLADCLRLAAKTEILPRFRKLGSGDVRSKSEPTDLVTEADEAAERMIRREITAIAPDALFIGEESVAADPDLLGKLAQAELAIVV